MDIEFKIPIYPSKNHAYHGYYCADKINTAFRLNKIKKQPCEICGSLEHIEKHHEDYNNPLDIRWLCRVHHLDLHKLFRHINKQPCLELF